MALSSPLTVAVKTYSNSRWSLASLRSAFPSLSSSITAAPTTYFSITLSRRCPHQQPLLVGSFTGLSPLNPLLSLGFSDSTAFGHGFPVVNNGCWFFPMIHGKRVPKLNRPPDQRRALLRGLTTQLEQELVLRGSMLTR